MTDVEERPGVEPEKRREADKLWRAIEEFEENIGIVPKSMEDGNEQGAMD